MLLCLDPDLTVIWWAPCILWSGVLECWSEIFGVKKQEMFAKIIFEVNT